MHTTGVKELNTDITIKGPKRRKFKRTKSGTFRYWELEQCLNDDTCPLDGPTKLNLKFLIGLRNEIEHHQSVGV